MSFFSTPTAEDNLKKKFKPFFLTLYECYFMKAYEEWKLWDITISVSNLCDSFRFVLNVIFYVLKFCIIIIIMYTQPKYAIFANGNFNKL